MEMPRQWAELRHWNGSDCSDPIHSRLMSLISRRFGFAASKNRAKLSKRAKPRFTRFGVVFFMFSMNIMYINIKKEIDRHERSERNNWMLPAEVALFFWKEACTAPALYSVYQLCSAVRIQLCTHMYASSTHCSTLFRRHCPHCARKRGLL